MPATTWKSLSFGMCRLQPRKFQGSIVVEGRAVATGDGEKLECRTSRNKTTTLVPFPSQDVFCQWVARKRRIRHTVGGISWLPSENMNTGKEQGS